MYHDDGDDEDHGLLKIEEDGANDDPAKLGTNVKNSHLQETERSELQNEQGLEVAEATNIDARPAQMEDLRERPEFD